MASNFRADLLEHLQDCWVELAGRVLRDDLNCGCVRQGRLVEPATAQCVVDVRDCYQAGGERDGIVRQALRIPGAIVRS